MVTIPIGPSASVSNNSEHKNFHYKASPSLSFRNESDFVLISVWLRILIR